jgi:hypothetical protein
LAVFDPRRFATVTDDGLRHREGASAMQTGNSSVAKALFGIGGILGFFLILMHSLTQLFR